MAAPTFISSGGITADISGAASTAPVPGTHATNDILIACARNDTVAMTTATGGWAEIPVAGGINGTIKVQFWWLRAPGAGTAGPTITASAGNQFANVMVVRGAATSRTPFEAATLVGDGTTATTTPSTGTITTQGTDRLICAFTCKVSSAVPTGWPPSGWLGPDNSSNATGTGTRHLATTRTEATAGTYGPATVGTFTSTRYGGIIMAFFEEGNQGVQTLSLTGMSSAEAFGTLVTSQTTPQTKTMSPVLANTSVYRAFNY